MSDTTPKPGTIGWIDLTVQDAPKVRDFYQKVVGWSPEAVDMGGYSDFSMKTDPDGDGVAGICHARGSNAELPPVWIIYIIVTNLDESLQQVKALDGEIILGPKAMGSQRYAMIKDPGGAVCALFQAE